MCIVHQGRERSYHQVGAYKGDAAELTGAQPFYLVLSRRRLHPAALRRIGNHEEAMLPKVVLDKLDQQLGVAKRDLPMEPNAYQGAWFKLQPVGSKGNAFAHGLATHLPRTS